MDTTITEKESLRIIKEMIETSRNNFKDNGFFFLLWGWLALIASLLHFILLYIGYEYHYLPWPVLMSAGAIVSVIAGIKIGKKARVMSHIDKTIIYLWWGFFITIVILLFAASAGKLPWTTSTPLIIAMVGLGTFASGGALKFPPLIIGGIAAWIISVITLFIPYTYVLLMTALSIIIAYLIPGYMLKSKS